MLAERTLSKTQEPQCVSIELPVEGDKGEFECSFSIAWPEGSRTGTASGYDAIQVILLAMNMIAANLYVSSTIKRASACGARKMQDMDFLYVIHLKIQHKATIKCCEDNNGVWQDRLAKS